MNKSKQVEHRIEITRENIKQKKDTKLHAYQNKEEREPDTKYSVTTNKSMGQTNKLKTINRTNENHAQRI